MDASYPSSSGYNNNQQQQQQKYSYPPQQQQQQLLPPSSSPSRNNGAASPTQSTQQALPFWKRIIPYHVSFMVAIVFSAGTLWTSIIQRNMIEVVWMIGYNFGIVVFTIIQITQNQKTLSDLNDNNFNTVVKISDANYPSLHWALVILPVVSGIWAVVLLGLGYMLYKEFGWYIYRITAGDKAMEKVTDAMVLANASSMSEILTPLIGIPIIAVTVYFGYWGMRNEREPFVYGYVVGAFVMIIFVGWRIQRIVDPANNADYHAIKTPLLFWGILSLVHLLAAVLVAFNCKKKFHMGLRSLLDQERDVKKHGADVVQNTLPTMPTAMQFKRYYSFGEHLLAAVLVAFGCKKKFHLGLRSLLDQERDVKKHGADAVQNVNVVVNLDE
ncbi:hypothetical protein HDU76_003341 [Blyttiomyces sp. JEL0837]|nr:hypothetical protein HDU76_003341 [Blyttiomyces sp. JEL0837]